MADVADVADVVGDAPVAAAPVGPVGPVRLGVPPDPSMSRVARLAASGLASLAGCTVDEIEDIKIAVSEVLIALIEHGDHQRVDLEFEVVERERVTASGALPDTPAFVVRGTSPVRAFDLGHPDLALCRTVLDGVCAGHDIELVDGFARITASVAMLEIR